jgi:Leucine-rich repeat (LRR) protein
MHRSQNKLRELAPGLAQLQELRSLSVSCNPLGVPNAAPVARGIGGVGGTHYGADAAADAGPGGGLPEEAAALPQLASLACADCGLERLPEALGDGRGQPALAQLLAGGNRLARLPAGLAGAAALVRLELQVRPNEVFRFHG